MEIHSIIMCVSIILVLLIYFILIFKKEKNNKDKSENDKEKIIDSAEVKGIWKYKNIIIILIFVIAILIRVINIETLPNDMNVDETGIAYDAYSISEYGVDRYLNKFPVYFINFGGGQSVLYTYILAAFMSFFGNSLVVVRLPSIILSLISLVVIYKLVKQFHGEKSAILMMFIYSIMPWHIMQSRWGLDCNLLSSMILISTYMLVTAKSNLKYILAGILFGITLYSYILSLIIVPIMLTIISIYLIYIKKAKVKNIIAVAIPVVILVIPILLMLLVNNGVINEIKTDYFTIPTLNSFRGGEVSLNNVFENILSIDEIFISDGLAYNAIPEFGTLYIFSIPIVIFGIIILCINTARSIKNKEFSVDVIMLSILIANIVCFLVIKDPNINKLNSIFIPLIYSIYLTLKYTYKSNKIFLYVLIAIYIINFISFTTYYFTKYNEEYSEHIFWSSNMMDLTKYIEKYEVEEIYLDVNTRQPWIYTLYTNEISPYNFNESITKESKTNYINMYSYGKYNFNMISEIKENSIYIFENMNEFENVLIQNGYEKEEYLVYRIYYK